MPLSRRPPEAAGTVRQMSLTLRLTAFFALVGIVVLLSLGYLIGATVEQHFVEQDADLLRGKLSLVRYMLDRVKTDDDLSAVPQRLDDALVGEPGLAVVVVAPAGQVLFATSGAAFPDELLKRPPSSADASSPHTWLNADGQPMRGISALLPTGMSGSAPARVGVATDISHHESYLRRFRLTLWSFVAGAALLIAVLGWLSVRHGLAPLQAMRRKAASITAERLDARLAVDSVPGELADLATSLNGMLARLEGSFRRLSDFSSDLAHEFRTPIANLMTQTQVMLARPRTPEEYREVLASNIEEYERLSRMVADMLFLAKADNGQLVTARATLALGELVRDLVDYHQLAAEEKGVGITCSGAGTLRGDALMIRRAVANLLSNAVRYTPAGGDIQVAVRETAGWVSIEVVNSGETIAAQHLPRLFDRFYRADPARGGEAKPAADDPSHAPQASPAPSSPSSPFASHAGLGLAIVKSIVEAHGGRVAVSSADGVTRFTLRFPAAH